MKKRLYLFGLAMALILTSILINVTIALTYPPYYYFFNDPTLSDQSKWGTKHGAYGNYYHYFSSGIAYLMSETDYYDQWQFSQFGQGHPAHGDPNNPAWRYGETDTVTYLNSGYDYLQFNIDPSAGQWAPENAYWVYVKAKITERTALRDLVSPQIDPLGRPWTGIGVGIGCQYEGWAYNQWVWSDYNNPDAFHSPPSQLYIDVHFNFRNWKYETKEWIIPGWVQYDTVVHRGTKYDNDFHVGTRHFSAMTIGEWNILMFDLGRIMNDAISATNNYLANDPNAGVTKVRHLRVYFLAFYVESAGARIKGEFDEVKILKPPAMANGWTQYSKTGTWQQTDVNGWATQSNDVDSSIQFRRSVSTIWTTFKWQFAYIDWGDTFTSQWSKQVVDFRVGTSTAWCGYRIEASFVRSSLGVWRVDYVIKSVNKGSFATVKSFTIYHDDITFVFESYPGSGNYRIFALQWYQNDRGSTSFAVYVPDWNYGEPTLIINVQKTGNGWVQGARGNEYIGT